MPSWGIALIALGGVGALAAVAAIVVHALERAGAADERARRAEADAAVAKRQGEIMTEERTADDAADRLDAGRF